MLSPGSRTTKQQDKVPSAVDLSRAAVLNISGPYGVGKDTLLAAITNRFGDRVHRVSTLTTRDTTPDSDPSYSTVARDELLERTKTGNWIVTSQLNNTTLYATNLDEIFSAHAENKLSIHSIYAGDQGAGELRRRLGHRLLSIGLLASEGNYSDQVSALTQRLVNRGRESAEQLEARIRSQEDAIQYILGNPVVSDATGQSHQVFDKVLVNSDLRQCVSELLALVEPLLPQ